MDPVLQTKLLRLSLRERRLRQRSVLGACWFLVGFVGLAVLLLNRRYGWESYWVPAVLAGTALLGALVAIGRLRAPVDWHKLALQIEHKHPELEGRLLTLVRNAPGASSTNNFFDQRLVDEVLRHETEHDWMVSVSKFRLGAANAAQWLALLLVGIVCWAAWPGPKKLTKPNEYPLWGISVSPGDTSLEKGTPLVVMARFGAMQPSTVELVFGSTNESQRRIPLVKSLSDPMFGASVPDVSSNISYHVEYNGKRTRDYLVTVYEHPRLERADADLTYPEYTQQAPKHVPDSRRISAVQGTRVDYLLALNKPVAKARLVARAPASGNIDIPVEDSMTVRFTNFLLMASGTYDLLLVDGDGRTNKAQSTFVFLALTNTAPELKFASPRGDLRPTALEEIPFEGTVWDDFGIAAFGLGYQLVGKDIIYVQLGESVPAREKRSLSHLMRLEDLGVKPDQVVAWFLWADDVGPDGETRRSTTDLFFGEVRPFEEVFREAQGGMAGQSGGQGQGQQGGDQENPTAKVAEVQKQILNATWKLQRQQGRKPSMDKPAPRRESRVVPSGRDMDVLMVNAARVFGQRAENPRRNRTREDVREPRRPNASEALPSDIEVLIESQEEAIRQAKAAVQKQEDPRAATLWRAAIKDMEAALERLKQASTSGDKLTEAVSAQQAAYQALLKLQEHEHQVARSRQSQGQSGNGRQAQMRQQLEQMELTQSENRYETRSQAQKPDTVERGEQLQVLNRLQELARRQQDVNERLKDIQSALLEARTEQEKEELRRQLKRLQEEQQEMLADVDDLKQKMDAPANASKMEEQRQQLEQAREDIQKASQAAAQGSASQAAAAGARAQNRLEQMRDELRKQSSGQFGDELRELRNEARELAKAQEELMNRLQTPGANERKSLSDSGQKEETFKTLEAQRQRVTNLVGRATAVSQEAETSEPILSRQLHDSLRQFTQETARDAKEMQEQLLLRGMMTRNLMDKLRDPTATDATKLLDTTGEMMRMDMMAPARDAGSRAQAAFDQLRRGVERAAESVVGDDTEALRQAQETIEKLTEQLQTEVARETGETNRASALGPTQGRADTNSVHSALSMVQQASTNANASATSSGTGAQERNSGRTGETAQAAAEGQDGSSEERNAQGQGQSTEQAQASGQGGQSQSPGQTQQQPGQGQQQGEASGQNQGASQGQEEGGQRSEVAQGGEQRGQPGFRQGGRRGQRNQLGGSQDGGGAEGGGAGGGTWQRAFDDLFRPDDVPSGPIIGEGFVPWSNQLRDAEELVEDPNLRNEIARVRDRARQMRQDFKRDHKKPDWAVVRLQLVEPLAQIRDQIADELARRGSREALVPVDRDPVPSKYSELVRKYYEQLGK